MAELKTQKNEANVESFINGLDDPQQRDDSKRLARLMEEITGDPPAMWGGSIIGFGAYRYSYASGRSNDWFQVGFSPRKGNLALYFLPGVERYGHHLERLGKYKTGKSCLYVKRLGDIDWTTLSELIRECATTLKASEGKTA